jgi:transposase InsO family protein
LTDSPTAAWTAQQIVEALPDDSAPRYLLRDRDSIYGREFRQRVKGIGIAEVLAAPRSPWQNPFVERVIGTIRRELLDFAARRSRGRNTSPSSAEESASAIGAARCFSAREYRHLGQCGCRARSLQVGP